MKKLLTSALIFTFLFSGAVGCSATSDNPTNISQSSQTSSVSTVTPTITSEVPLDTLMVGTGAMSGDFISGFGTNAYDLSIRVLTSGYINTYAVTPEGDIVLNETVVENLNITTDEVGNKTYAFKIYEDLFWNNGDQITAEEFVASVLWYSSPQLAEAGATSVGADGLIGYTEYKAGETDVFAGVQLLGDFEFSVTISAEELPYFWEVLHATVGPIHMDTYLPSCEVVSTADGTSFLFSEGDLLTNCVNVVETERYAPTVTSGPYTFVSYENDTVTLARNEHFKGDHNGDVPAFEYIVQKAIPSETDVEWVISGQVDYVAGVVESEKIEAAKASDTAQLQTYLRSGFGYLAMMCDEGPTADVNVRWALASLVDRNEVVSYVLGGYGGTVDSEYGIGQWMYQETAADLQDALKPISFNISTANDYLDNTEWIYEADGTTAFDRTKANTDGTYLRHNASGEKLVINHLGTSDNVLTDIIEIQYTANAPLAGLEFNLAKSEWSAVLENFYYSYELPSEERIYNTFNLATNFSSVFDRYAVWHSDYMGTVSNKGQLSDPELDELILAMRECDPTDKDAYLDAWFDYQVRWNELMPQVPLYSNEYFDVSHIYVDNMDTTPYASYHNIICQIEKSAK